jgi:adenylate cyclase
MSPLAGALALGAAGAVALALALALVRARRAARDAHEALVQAKRELERLELAFGRFAPAAVVEKIAGGVDQIQPERKQVTFMFADLVGFTRLSEELDPAVMVGVLNGYFRTMSRTIAEHHGHVSRIMGDGLLALFGALELNPWQAADAVRAALAMRAELVRYNADLATRGLPALSLGAGIHCGEVVAGVVGSDELMEFTALGDPINLAARVEALTRTHAVGILVTEEVRAKLDARFRLREMPAAAVKGKAAPLVTWAVDAYDDDAPAPALTDR